jgi:hypothetical protein
MSNDYALFMIHLPNDFDNETSITPVTSHIIKSAAPTVSLFFINESYSSLCFTSHQLVQYLL